MAPPPFSIIAFAARCESTNGAFSITSRTKSHLSRSISRNGASSKTPALLISTSTRPQRSSAASTSPSQTTGSAMSPASEKAAPPSASSSATVRFRSSSLRPPISTSAPSATRRPAIVRPSPLLPPVTIAVLPLKRSNLAPLSGCCASLEDPGCGSSRLGRHFQADRHQGSRCRGCCGRGRRRNRRARGTQARSRR